MLVSSQTRGTEPGGRIEETSFEFLTPEKIDCAWVSEIEAFLDSQNTSNPYSFPRWISLDKSASDIGYCIFRVDGRVRWLAHCTILEPWVRYGLPLRALLCNHGPICDDATLLMSALKELAWHANANNFVFAELNPEIVCREESSLCAAFAKQGWASVPKSATTLRLSLAQTNEGIVRQFRQTTRYEIRKAERLGVIVQQGGSHEDISAFLRMYTTMAAKKRFYANSLNHVLGVIHWIEEQPQRGALLLAKLDGRVLGGVVILRSGERCWYIWGATEKEEIASVGHLLQWHAILWAKSHGCTDYDFGGFTENATSGPALFKRGFRGEVVHFMPPQRLHLGGYKSRVMLQLSGIKSRLQPLVPQMFR